MIAIVRPKRDLIECTRSARLILRRASEADLDIYCERIYADPAVMRTLPGRKPIEPRLAKERARANLIGHWQDFGFGPWIVEDRSSSRLLGHCGLRYWPESEDVEILYALESACWGRGLASEAAARAYAAAFEELGLSRLIAGVVPDNAASIRVLEKLGMICFEERSFADLQVRMFESAGRAKNIL